MLTFLAPAALTGALLLAIPILVHLFKPRKTRPMPFSSLRWLHLSPQRLSRRMQWHQLLLFLLRAAFVVLLVLALSKPLVGIHSESRPVDRFIVIDVSRSMAYEPPKRPSPLARAKQIAADLVHKGRSGDRTAILLTGSSTRIMTPPVGDAEPFLPAIAALEAGATDTDLSSALPVLRPMLDHSRNEADVELVFLTDNVQQSWSEGPIAEFVKELPKTVRARLVDVGEVSAQNAWISGARLLTLAEPARRILRVEVGCVGDAQQDRTVRVSGLAGLADRSQTVTIERDRPAPVDLEIPPSLELKGQVARIELEPADGLPSDDVFFLNLDNAAALRVLLVEPESSVIDSLRPGFHLRTAIDALAATGNQSIALTTRKTADATAHDLSEADVVFLAGVEELSDSQLSSLENRVHAGAGLVLFLGPGIKPAFYNNKLCKPLHPSEGLLPVTLGTVEQPQAPRAALAPISDIRWNHPLLSPLSDPVFSDLGKAAFRSYCRFRTSLPAGDTVLAWIDDEVPAIVEHNVGAGKVVLFNTSANDTWSDLPRLKSYLPLVDRLLAYLSAGGVRRTFTVGETITLPLADWKPGETVSVQAPHERTFSPPVRVQAGRAVIRLDDVVEPGVFRVERPQAEDKGYSFVVQVGHADSVLVPSDAATLASWWEPVALERLTPDAFASQASASSRRYALWPWLVALAGLVFAAEMYLVHRLCPRVNPVVTDSLVQKGRLLRPLAHAPEEGAHPA